MDYTAAAPPEQCFFDKRQRRTELWSDKTKSGIAKSVGTHSLSISTYSIIIIVYLDG